MAPCKALFKACIPQCAARCLWKNWTGPASGGDPGGAEASGAGSDSARLRLWFCRATFESGGRLLGRLFGVALGLPLAFALGLVRLFFAGHLGLCFLSSFSSVVVQPHRGHVSVPEAWRPAASMAKACCSSA